MVSFRTEEREGDQIVRSAAVSERSGRWLKKPPKPSKPTKWRTSAGLGGGLAGGFVRPRLMAEETQTNVLAPIAADGGVFFTNGDDLDVRVDGNTVTFQSSTERHVFIGLPAPRPPAYRRSASAPPLNHTLRPVPRPSVRYGAGAAYHRSIQCLRLCTPEGHTL